MQRNGDPLTLTGESSTSTAASSVHRKEEVDWRAELSAGKIRTLIADDQLMACEMLRRLLKDEEDVEIVGTPGSGFEAVEAINRLKPDLVFLDIKMPGLDGFDVVKRIQCPRPPVIIFVTASEGFATKAFEVHALDYLVKPCDPERFQSALHRARAQLRQNHNRELHEKLKEILIEITSEAKPSERIAVKANGRIVFLHVLDVDWVEAADNYVVLHVGQQAHLVRQTMNRLESRLPSGDFLRISRSAIVNIERVKELHPLFHGEYAVLLRNGKRLVLTRTYRERLHQLGLA